MSVYYPLTNYDQRVYLNPYPHANAIQPFYVSYPYYTYNTNEMIYNNSTNDPFTYRYDRSSDARCHCNEFRTVAECIRQRSAYHCP